MSFALPQIMVAPNGARRGKGEHARIPLTVGEIVACGKACYEAGAGAMHAHVRDDKGGHILDAGLYRELIQEMHSQVPQMIVQITTESIGLYEVARQRQVVKDVIPQAASFALREMLSDNDIEAAREFYLWAQEADVTIQHILYDAEELRQFLELQKQGIFGTPPYQMLFVLGRYSKDNISSPQDLQEFLDAMEGIEIPLDWSICAFGKRETECLRFAVQQGGKCRVGFENSLYNESGAIATDNAERVREIANAVAANFST